MGYERLNSLCHPSFAFVCSGQKRGIPPPAEASVTPFTALIVKSEEFINEAGVINGSF